MAAISLGFWREWPDFVHVSYGFPFPWAVHVLVTFTGPTDFWSLNVSALLLDIIFWIAVLATVMVAALRVKGTQRQVYR